MKNEGSEKALQQVQDKAKLVRKWCLVSTTAANSGHATSCLSAADIATVLFDTYFSYDIKNPRNITNDRFVLSKGHASPLFYTLFAMAGGLPMEELKTLRKFGSNLQGHPMPDFKFTDVATGSLGQGLSAGAGFALLAKKENLAFKTFVLMGDSEMAEGSVWEAANFASYYKLNNLIAIVDVNRLGQSQETMYGHHLDEYVRRLSSCDFEVLAIDGHNYEEIDKALSLAVNNKSDRPFAIVAQTFKGRGVSFLENKDNWHGKPLSKDDLQKALKELGEVDDELRFELRSPRSAVAHPSTIESDARRSSVARGPVSSFPPASAPSKYSVRAVGSPSSAATPHYKIGDEVATRQVYGEVLAELGNSNPDVYALDAEVKNSTFSELFQKAHPQRFVECFIAEQNMVGVALGLSKLGKKPFASSFACFLTRAFDQIRMSVLSGGNIAFCGSHAGVSIGEDGPSQMGLEDIAMFGALPGTIIMQPADAVTTAKVLPLLADYNGISYLRTLRPKTKVIYNSSEKFTIGGSKILKQSKNDILTISATGITVFEALKAYEELKKESIFVRVVDCYSVKPVDEETLKKCLSETKKNTIITVEDHFAHGGLGDFVLSAVSQTGAKVEKMAVEQIMRSGTGDELLDAAGISSRNIIAKVKSLLK
ncbi:MAG TPA: transketolase [Candidatus Saccharimonadales bacterium]|nr:transketolase [Candidatus Saccharimonadales bacterium]